MSRDIRDDHAAGAAAFLRGGLGGPWTPHIFSGPPVLCLISRSSSCWHIQQVTFSQQYF